MTPWNHVSLLNPFMIHFIDPASWNHQRTAKKPLNRQQKLQSIQNLAKFYNSYTWKNLQNLQMICGTHLGTLWVYEEVQGDP